TDFRALPELGIQRDNPRPILTIQGRAREGTNSLPQLYEQFLGKLRGQMPASAGLEQKPSPNGAKFTIDLSFFVPREEPAPEAGANKPSDKPAPKSSGANKDKAH